MQGMKFVPATIMAKSGDGIRWTNLDLAPHTATATDARWTSPTLKKGETFTLEVTASMAGTYKCHFHPQMAGEIALLR